MSVPLLELPPLLAPWERVVYRECPGFQDECGTELDENDLTFCKPCQKEKEEAEYQLLLERDRIEEEMAKSSYRYLVLEDLERRVKEAVKATEHLPLSEECEQDLAGVSG